MADHLRLDATHAVRVASSGRGHRAEPVSRAAGGAGGWVRSTPGDGAGLALLRLLDSGASVEDGFRAATFLPAETGDGSERGMGVDQTHESWVVGDRMVVKWMTQDLVGPHPAADRLRRLAAAGYAESPGLVGLVEWREPAGSWVPVAVVQSYLPGTRDGWSWGLEEARRALGLAVDPESARSAGSPEVPETPGFGVELGDVVGRMHLALADDPPRRLTADLARRCADDALLALDLALGYLERHDPGSFALMSGHREQIAASLAGIADAVGTPVLPTHGDLHVGQVLRDADGRYAVVDFDGNPTLPADLRAAPGPAARDVAGMLVSLENVEHVVRHYAPELSDEDGQAWTAREQAAFLDGYRRALGVRAELYDDALLAAYDWDQVCREIVYAGQHDFVEWLYVPAGELRRRLGTGS